MRKILFLSGIGLLALSLHAEAFETMAKNALLMDAETGYVIYEKDADVPMPPASLSNLMTAYMIFAALNNGKITSDD